MHVLVVGAGVQGIANAYFLNRQGFEVTVLDGASAAGMECSFGNGGGLTPSAPWNDPGVYKMMLKYIGRKDASMMFRLKPIGDRITGSMYCAADGSADPHLFCQQMEQYTAARYSPQLGKSLDVKIPIKPAIR